MGTGQSDAALIYTSHARHQRRERGITETDVKEALRNYDVRRPAPSRAARPPGYTLGVCRA